MLRSAAQREDLEDEAARGRRVSFAVFSPRFVLCVTCALMNAQKRGQPSVEVPSPAADRPPWIKVGVIAAVGFVIGVAWPRLAGVHLGPAAPPEAAPSAVPATSQPERSGSPPRAFADSTSSSPPPQAQQAQPSSAAVVPAPAPPPQEVPSSVTVNRGVVLSCKTDEGETKKGVTDCGPVGGFDSIAQPRLRRLAGCPAALGANGKLSVVFNVDFPSNRVAVEIGKSSTVASVDGFAACVKPAFQGVSLGALDHQNPHYALFYSLVFSPKDAHATAATGSPVAVSPGSSASGEGLTSASASPPASSPATATDVEAGTAQVIWEVAIVRDTPRTGQVLARLQRGTKIRLGPGQDGWYPVKYGNDFSNEGWVYRGAIGR